MFRSKSLCVSCIEKEYTSLAYVYMYLKSDITLCFKLVWALIEGEKRKMFNRLKIDIGKRRPLLACISIRKPMEKFIILT